QYEELAQAALRSLTSAVTHGAWRTSVYILGDENSFGRLVGAWLSAYVGSDSTVEPVRVWPVEQSTIWATKWSFPNMSDDHDHFYQPFQFQTLLASEELASYVDLPTVE